LVGRGQQRRRQTDSCWVLTQDEGSPKAGHLQSMAFRTQTGVRKPLSEYVQRGRLRSLHAFRVPRLARFPGDTEARSSPHVSADRLPVACSHRPPSWSSPLCWNARNGKESRKISAWKGRESRKSEGLPDVAHDAFTAIPRAPLKAHPPRANRARHGGWKSPQRVVASGFPPPTTRDDGMSGMNGMNGMNSGAPCLDRRGGGILH